jgi:phosphoglycolate phosphatase/pyrophosphatase PpaX
MLKCVIFDLDGTIANTQPLCLAAFRAALKAVGSRELTDAEITATYGPSEEGCLRAMVGDRAGEAIRVYLKYYKDNHERLCPAPFSGLLEIFDLARARGATLAIITGKSAASLAIDLAAFGLGKIFQIIKTGRPEGPDKPCDMRAVLNELGLEPREAVYVGDAPTDITGARTVGLSILAAAWAPGAEREHLMSLAPDRLCLTVADLADYLKENLPTSPPLDKFEAGGLL